MNTLIRQVSVPIHSLGNLVELKRSSLGIMRNGIPERRTGLFDDVFLDHNHGCLVKI